MANINISVGLLGAVPESIRVALRASGYDVQEASQGVVDIVVAHARGDWPTFPKGGAVVIAVCDTVDDMSAAYRAGAYFASPADATAVQLLVERALESKGPERRDARSLANLEREAILAAMKASAGSTARAAAMLDISVRKVQYKLHEYGVPLTRRGARANGSTPSD
jgi:hypothetical protein